MRFDEEPTSVPGTAAQTAVVLTNLGTPNAPTVPAVRSYLKEFLSDPRVVEIPKAVWWLILNGIILPFRSRESAQKYSAIWTNEGSPLKFHTERQAQLLQQALRDRGHQVQVAWAMRYGEPALPQVLAQLKQQGCGRILILPAYPQYSGTTTASLFDVLSAYYLRVRNIPELRMIRGYHDHEGYIAALKTLVLNYWDSHGRPDKLVMSFHGIPKRTVQLGDPYYEECQQTARALALQLGLGDEQYLVTFQSRLGRAEWLQPYTAPALQQLAKSGVQRVDVICPGFVCDCLETLEEIAMEARREFLSAGGKQFHYIPCLNEAPSWIAGLAGIVEQHLAGWPTRMPQQEPVQPSLSSHSMLPDIGE